MVTLGLLSLFEFRGLNLMFFWIEIETLTHPIINEFRHQLEEEFYRECEAMKRVYEEKLRNLSDNYQVSQKELRNNLIAFEN